MKGSVNLNWFLILNLLFLTSLLIIKTEAKAQTAVLNNSKIRIGDGIENSINSSGNLQQPFYFNKELNAWRQLTISTNPLDNAFAIGGDKSNEWNLNGTIVQNPQLSKQTINKTSFVITNGNKGFGTIISKGFISIAGSMLEIENTYILPQNSNYLKVKVRVKNVSVAPVENVRLWIGTRDDWVGNTDKPIKQKGNLIGNNFINTNNAATKASALKVSTSQEGILFYTNSKRGNTIIQKCCKFQNIINQNPQTSTQEITDDGSYAFYVRLNDLAVGASDEFTWYYASGELPNFEAIIREVAIAASNFSNITAVSAKYTAISDLPVNGYWMIVPHNSIPPTTYQIKAGGDYGSVKVKGSGRKPMPAHLETKIDINSLTPETDYHFYFVTEDANSKFSEIIKTQLKTHALPSISNLVNQSICQDTSIPNIEYTVNDAETSASDLRVSATSSNTRLIANSNIVLGGSGKNRTLSLSPQPGQYGTSTITVLVTNTDGDTKSATFLVTVNQKDFDPPVVRNITYLLDDKPNDLSAQVSGTNLLWYTGANSQNSSSVSPIPSTHTIGSQEFWVSQAKNGCVSPKAKIIVTVLPLNDIVGSTTNRLAYFKQASVIDQQIMVSGKDVANAQVYIHNGFDPSADILTPGTLPTGITSTYDSATGILNFLGMASALQWQGIFRSIQFQSLSANHTDRTIKFILGDGIRQKVEFSRVISYYQPVSPSSPQIAGSNNRFINKTNPTFIGLASPQSTIHLYDSLNAIGSTTANINGEWSFTVTENFSEGRHCIFADAMDLLGFKSEKTAPLTFIVDIQKPDTPSLPLLSGGFNNYINNNTPTISGVAESNSLVKIYTNKLPEATMMAGADGKWSYTYITNLPEGTNSVSVIAVDAAGNYSNTSEPLAFIVDTEKPQAPSVPVLLGGRNNINDNTPTIKGVAEPGSRVLIFFTEEVVAQNIQVGADGNWLFKFNNMLSDGKYMTFVKAIDAAGNISSVSPGLEIIIDTQAPAIPNVPALTNGDYGLINNNTPTIGGVAEPESELIIYLNDQPVASFNVKTDGLWQYKFNEALKDGKQIIYVSAKDAAGNLSRNSLPLEINIDTIVPAGYTIILDDPEINYTNQTKVSFQVINAEEGSTYNYIILSDQGTNTVSGKGVVKQSQFRIKSLNLTDLIDGNIIIKLWLVDAAGNKGNTVVKQVIKTTKDVKVLKPLAKVQVPFGTTFQYIKLPAKVKVTYSSGEVEEIPVVWHPGDYDGFKNRTYDIIGTLTLVPGTTNSSNLQASIPVVVQSNKAPIGLRLSATHFNPGIPSNEPIGSFSTLDPDDTEFTFTLVNGAGDPDNHLFDIRKNQLYLKSNQKLSGKAQFSIRVRTTDAYNNQLEDTFTLIKETYIKAVDQLKIVNSFTPNGDGVNDEWTVPELKFYNKVSIEIFDRSGVKLFYTTNPEKGWDGKNQNGQVLQGAFLYIIKVEDINMVKKGVITVLKR